MKDDDKNCSKDKLAVRNHWQVISGWGKRAKIGSLQEDEWTWFYSEVWLKGRV